MSQLDDGRNRLIEVVPPAEMEVAQPAIPLHVKPGDPASRAVHASLIRGVGLLRSNEPAALQGDAEGVHLMRTAARRLRGELRAFRPLVEPTWSEHLAEELRWLGRVLGAVRDLDVLLARLERDAADLTERLEPLFEVIRERHRAARVAMHEALGSPRYRRLLGRLTAVPAEVPLAHDADEPCRTALPPLVRALWKPLKRKARALDDESHDEDVHLVRRRAKRVRYAAEVAARCLGRRAARRAERFAKRAKDIQDVLGQYQDAIVGRREIEGIVNGWVHPGPESLVAIGRLLERQDASARAARAEFSESWDRIDCKRLRRWMEP